MQLCSQNLKIRWNTVAEGLKLCSCFCFFFLPGFPKWVTLKYFSIHVILKKKILWSLSIVCFFFGFLVQIVSVLNCKTDRGKSLNICLLMFLLWREMYCSKQHLLFLWGYLVLLVTAPKNSRFSSLVYLSCLILSVWILFKLLPFISPSSYLEGDKLLHIAKASIWDVMVLPRSTLWCLSEQTVRLNSEKNTKFLI